MCLQARHLHRDDVIECSNVRRALMRPKFHENRIICKYWYLHWHNYDTNISKLIPPPPELLTNASTFVVAFTFEILMWILLLGMLLWRRLLLLLLNSWIGGGYSVGASVAGPNQIGHSLIQSKSLSVNTFTSTRTHKPLLWIPDENLSAADDDDDVLGNNNNSNEQPPGVSRK